MHVWYSNRVIVYNYDDHLNLCLYLGIARDGTYYSRI